MKYYENDNLTSAFVERANGTVRICEKPDCTIAAAEIINAMDESQDPCEDFVEFACGGWKKSNPVNIKLTDDERSNLNLSLLTGTR